VYALLSGAQADSLLLTLRLNLAPQTPAVMPK